MTLTHSTFISALKKTLPACGFDPSQYSGHSYRRGGASHAFVCKVPDAMIKLHGDWKSNAYLRYFEIPFDVRLKIMSVMTGNL